MEIVPVVHLPPPPTDQIIKVRGRKLLLQRGRVISDVNRPPHRPQVAARWRKEGNVNRGAYKVCVDTAGRVSSVSTLQPAGNRVLDGSFRQAIGTWRYRPTKLGNKPVPLCYRLGITVTYAARPCVPDADGEWSADCSPSASAEDAPGPMGARQATVHAGR
jgi:TonB family protein